MARELSIREQVEQLLPNWRSWYPSVFHAAEDLGIIRARVCSPDSLLLTNRHAKVVTYFAKMLIARAEERQDEVGLSQR